MKKYIILCIAILLFVLNAYSQDPIFSLFDRSPMLINPALAGNIPDGQVHRFAYQHRVQWFDALTEYRYEHFAFAYDRNFAICSGSKNATSLGAGLQVVSESIPYLQAEPNFHTNKIALDLAYRRSLSRDIHLSGGIEGEWLQHRLLTDGLQFPSQYDGLGSFSGAPNGESNLALGNASADAFSLGFGIALTLEDLHLTKIKRMNSGARSRKNWNLGQMRMGMSIYHLTRPNLSLLNNENDQQADISQRWTTYWRWRLPITKATELIPYAFYTAQGKGVWQLVSGMDIGVGEYTTPRLIPGVGIRLTNPLVSNQTFTSLLLNLRLENKQFSIAGSTDIGFPTFAAGSNDKTVSTFELSIAWRWGNSNSKCASLCPSF